MVASPFWIKPVTVSLILTALFACFGMSVFTGALPFDWLFGCLSGTGGRWPEAFALRPFTLPILAFSVWALYTRRLSIMAVILLSALAGGFWAWLSL